MRNQFGQDIQVGAWVGWAGKTGSHTTRKVGKVLGFGQRDTGYNSNEVTARIDWVLDGSYGNSARPVPEGTRSTGVGINRLFKLDFDSIL